MRRDVDKARVFARRALLLGGAQAAAFALLAGRLYKLQVAESGAYATLADANRVDESPLAPARGAILDRFGRPLAVNRPIVRLSVVPERAGDLPTLLDRLARLVRLTPEDRAAALDAAANRPGFLPVPLRDDLSRDEVAAVAVRTPDLPGVVLDEGLRRTYPAGRIASGVVGYVGPPAEADLTGDPLTALPEFRLGKTGVEKARDATLRGRAGTLRVEVNALGREVREIARAPGTPGESCRLALDLDLQRFVHGRLADVRSAAAALIDAGSGAVRALVSTPGFDPEPFTGGIDRAAWRALTDDPLTPLVNKAVAGQYPPGSTFKIVVALAALEAGVIDADTAATCRGRLRLGNHDFHCWRKEGHGRLSLVRALSRSCDVFFYETAQRVGIDAIASAAARLGLGVDLGLDLPGERPGLVPTRAWKAARFGEGWRRGETLIAGIGQGYVLATPLQLAVMTARLASGRAVRPWLAGAAAPPGPPADLGFDPAHRALVLQGLFDVVNGAGGTARASALRLPGVFMAGKTGTSQVRRIGRAERAAGLHKRERPWEARDHALFVALAPHDRPAFAVAVVVEHGESGSKTAAPIARDILERALRPPGDRLAAFDEGEGG